MIPSDGSTLGQVESSEFQGMLETVIEFVLRPFVEELSKETGQSMLLKVGVVNSHPDIAASLYVGEIGAEGTAAVNGEIRVVFKDLARPSRFSVEAILDGFARGTGYSGFSMRGRVRVNDGGLPVRVTGYVNRYNVREWGRDFRVT